MGTGNLYSTLFRQNSPLYGAWLSIDPLADKYPGISPYVSMGCNPIMMTDVLGLEPDGRCPEYPDPIFGLGLSLGTGGFKANFNFTLDQSIGDFTGSYGLGVTYHSNFHTTGKSGLEFRNSFMLNYNDGTTDVSVGTNFWSGTGSLKEFEQRTGMLSFSSGDFSFSYENDGTPFQLIGLGDGGDSYRTAAASIGIGDFSLNMNLVTGLRNQDSYDIERFLPGGEKGIPQGLGKFGEYYKHGFVEEKGTKYRYGGLTMNYKGMSGGVNSEWVRHIFQNVVAHDIIKSQRQFPMQSDDWKPVSNFYNQYTRKFTIWE